MYGEDDGSAKLKIDSVPSELQLDVRCGNCKDGVVYPRGIQSDRPDGKCNFCHGVGFTLTNNGDAVLRFIQRWKDRI